MYLFKALAFVFMQQLYIAYVYDSKPHTLNLFNWLEIFNEGALMLLGYMSIAFTGIV